MEGKPSVTVSTSRFKSSYILLLLLNLFCKQDASPLKFPHSSGKQCTFSSQDALPINKRDSSLTFVSIPNSEIIWQLAWESCAVQNVL